MFSWNLELYSSFQNEESSSSKMYLATLIIQQEFLMDLDFEQKFCMWRMHSVSAVRHHRWTTFELKCITQHYLLTCPVLILCLLYLVQITKMKESLKCILLPIYVIASCTTYLFLQIFNLEACFVLFYLSKNQNDVFEYEWAIWYLLLKLKRFITNYNGFLCLHYE